MQIRVLDFGAVPPLRSQAVYHGAAAAMRDGDAPVITLCDPDAPYVCVGVHQDVAREVDESFCAERGLPIIRRMVGGGAVYLDGDQMFFHYIFPRALARERAALLYPRFIEPVLRTYRDLGIAAAYRPVNDIHVDGRKIGGTGAAHVDAAVVVVGSFMFDFDTATMARCLRVPSEKFRDKLRSGLDDYMTTMRKLLPQRPERASVKSVFLGHVGDCFGATIVESTPTVSEQAETERAEAMLEHSAWTASVGRRLVPEGVKIAAGVHLTEGTHKAPGGLIRVRLLERDGKIDEVELSGDFTCLPAERLAWLAEGLRGASLADPDALRREVEQRVAILSLDLPGVEAADLVSAIAARRHVE